MTSLIMRCAVDCRDLDLEAEQLEKYQKQLKKQLRMLDSTEPEPRMRPKEASKYGRLLVQSDTVK